MDAQKFITYLRVSTKRQGSDGLGIEAQRSAVAGYLKSSGGVVLREFVEVESGARNDRAQLATALHLCKVTGAVLVIAKLDRLSRDAAFLLNLQKSRVRFVAVDNPHATDLTVGILALVAQHEREMIRTRVKAALAEAKKRGTKLGNYDHNARALRAYVAKHGTGHAVRGIKAKADATAKDLLPIINDIRASGVTSLKGIAEELTNRGILTPRGKPNWHASSVSNVIGRMRSVEQKEQ